MPYSISHARKSARIDFKEIKSRVRKAQNKNIELSIREYVIAASIFLAHATLENYISDIFSGLANGLQSSPIKGSEIPKILQAHLFLNRIDKTKLYSVATGTLSESDSLKSIAKSLSSHAGTVVDNSKTVFRFSGKDIFTNYKYPSVDNINRIFFRIGEPKIFQKLDAALKTNSQNLLESLGSLRSQLAHTGEVPGISLIDVVNRIKGIESFISGIDRVMYKIVISLLNQEVWRSHLCQ